MVKFYSMKNIIRKVNKKKVIIAVCLIVFGAVTRYFLKDWPNVETVTVVSLLAGSCLGGIYALIVPLSVIALSDMSIGNNSILLFTWSAWALIGLLGLFLRKKKKTSFKFSMQLTGMGVIASCLFFIWTNFGVWLLFPMYPHTWQGLVQCYIMGLPFLRYSLVGNLIIVPVVSFSLLTLWQARSVFGEFLSKKLKKLIIKN